MKLKILIENLQFYQKEYEDKDLNVVILLKDRSIGGQACADITNLHTGIDWDNGKLFLASNHNLCKEERVRDNIQYLIELPDYTYKKPRILYYCPKCSNITNKNNKYCPYCGQRIQVKHKDKEV